MPKFINRTGILTENDLNLKFDYTALLLTLPSGSFIFVNGDSRCTAKKTLGVQGWRSGESTCLPPMRPGFDSQIRL